MRPAHVGAGYEGQIPDPNARSAPRANERSGMNTLLDVFRYEPCVGGRLTVASLCSGGGGRIDKGLDKWKLLVASIIWMTKKRS